MSKFKVGEEVVLIKSVIPEMVGAIGEVVMSDSHISGRVVVRYPNCYGFENKDIWNSLVDSLISVKRFNGEVFVPKCDQSV